MSMTSTGSLSAVTPQSERPEFAWLETGRDDLLQRRWPVLCKCIFDRALALVALVLLLPLLCLIAGAVRAGSTGPALFCQQRDGYLGEPFVIVKFRTMLWSGGGQDGCDQACRGDCRLTAIGAFLRRTSLDELPQLWNVLTGTMSFVGPRPHPCAMLTEGKLGHEIAADYSARLRVKPGMTGLAQINGHRGATATAAALQARLADDLAYIEGWSLLLDLQILALTPVRLITRRENAF